MSLLLAGASLLNKKTHLTDKAHKTLEYLGKNNHKGILKMGNSLFGKGHKTARNYLIKGNKLAGKIQGHAMGLHDRLSSFNKKRAQLSPKVDKMDYDDKPMKHDEDKTMKPDEDRGYEGDDFEIEEKGNEEYPVTGSGPWLAVWVYSPDGERHHLTKTKEDGWAWIKDKLGWWYEGNLRNYKYFFDNEEEYKKFTNKYWNTSTRKIRKSVTNRELHDFNDELDYPQNIKFGVRKVGDWEIKEDEWAILLAEINARDEAKRKAKRDNM